MAAEKQSPQPTDGKAGRQHSADGGGKGQPRPPFLAAAFSEGEKESQFSALEPHYKMQHTPGASPLNEALPASHTLRSHGTSNSKLSKYN